MSSSYKQKKMKTLATRKKTRKRRIEDGMTFEDDSGRLFQPPSKRDPRWKKPSMESVVSTITQTKRQKPSMETAVSTATQTTRQKKAAKKRRKISEQQRQTSGDGEDEIEIVQREENSSDEEQEEEEKEKEEDNNGENSDAEEGDDPRLALPKTPLRLCKDLEDVVAKAAAKHAEIRRNDGRQKTKVLLLVDTRSLFKRTKKTMSIVPEMVKPKSKRGIGSGKKPELVYKNTGLVKTPLERFKDVNKEVMTGYKSGKLSTILAEDLSFYPYLDLKVQHVIFVAKQASSAINFNRRLLRNVELHSFVINDKSSTGVSEDEMKALEAAFKVTSG